MLGNMPDQTNAIDRYDYFQPRPWPSSLNSDRAIFWETSPYSNLCTTDLPRLLLSLWSGRLFSMSDGTVHMIAWWKEPTLRIAYSI